VLSRLLPLHTVLSNRVSYIAVFCKYHDVALLEDWVKHNRKLAV